MSEKEERRDRSVAILQKYGVPFMKGPLYIEEEAEVTPRTADEIAERAIACLLVIQVACDMNSGGDAEESRDVITDILERFGVEDKLTEKEKAILEGEPSKQDVVNMVWKYEAYWTLLWALGIVKELEYPDSICDCDFAVKAVSKHKSFDEFMKTVHLRSMSEILDQTDLILRYNWACVDERIKGREAPVGLHSGVVFERHWGLNWLTGKGTENDEWDSVSTDT